MKPIIECVPNFSEGRDKSIIDQIAEMIRQTEGATLLDVDPGADTNRTVVTFVGSPEGVLEAAFQAVKKASELIDMSKHHGAHPRMGATDVCPLIPVAGITDEECIELAKQLGERIGKELSIPVYLYGKAAAKPARVRLPDIREGEYEALSNKLKDPAFKPDFGPTKFNSKSGATAVGVRDFMLAYNINLNTKDRGLAREIALNIRESGRMKRDKAGQIVKDRTGNPVKIPGKLKFCQAGGWVIEEYGYAQVTMNLHNYKITGFHTAFETVRKEAARLGLRVTGSELIGLTPKQALLDAGIYYLKKQGKNIGIPEKEIIHTAILSLGLNDTTPFHPEEKVIEYAIEKEGHRLIDMEIFRFIDTLSSDAPAPGGGSVAALSGALSAALASMVANLTYGKKEYRRRNSVMEQLSVQAQALKQQYLDLIDQDTVAFNAYMTARKLPKKSDEEKKVRVTSMENAAKHMTEIPLQTLKLARDLVSLAETAAKKGNVNAISDAGVGAIQAEAAAVSAYLNIKINLPQIQDPSFKKRVLEEADGILHDVRTTSKRVVRYVIKKLE
jgi:glutamate formiminotransferase/formiminotetrahydrofolate cyclodeaminase